MADRPRSPSPTTGGTAPGRRCCETVARRLRRGRRPRVLDVGSADGPSVGWLRGHGQHDRPRHRPARPRARRGLRLRDAAAVPRRDASTWSPPSTCVEHCEPEADVARRAGPGARTGRPAAAVACRPTSGPGATSTTHNGHHRRYTRPRLVAAVGGAGLRGRAGDVRSSPRCFPFFAADRLARRMRAGRRHGAARRPPTSSTCRRCRPVVERLLMRLSGARPAGCSAAATCRSAPRCWWRPRKPGPADDRRARPPQHLVSVVSPRSTRGSTTLGGPVSGETRWPMTDLDSAPRRRPPASASSEVVLVHDCGPDDSAR